MAKRRSRGPRRALRQKANPDPHPEELGPGAADLTGRTPDDPIYGWEGRVTHVPAERMYSWESQVAQYPRTGSPGISYFPGKVSDAMVVDCLLYRDDTGELVGILNHYPVEFPPYQRQGSWNIWVHPGRRRQGIGTALLLEKLIRWGSGEAEEPKVTDSGLRFFKGLEGKYSGPEFDRSVEGWRGLQERLSKERGDPEVPNPPDDNPNP